MIRECTCLSLKSPCFSLSLLGKLTAIAFLCIYSVGYRGMNCFSLTSHLVIQNGLIFGRCGCHSTGSNSRHQCR